MVVYLRELVEQGAYKTALQLALDALMKQDHNMESLLIINLVVARCRIELRDHLAGLPSAEMAAKLARDYSLYDLRAEAEILKAVAYSKCSRYDDAIAALYTVIEIGPHLANRGWWEYNAWWNLGHVYERLGRHEDQLWALKNAWGLNWVVLEKRAQKTSLRTMLINAYLNIRDFASARRLLSEFKAEMASSSSDEFGTLLYYSDMSRLAFERGKYRLASSLALEGLDRAQGQPLKQVAFYKALYKSSVCLERPEEALGFALAARMAAIEGRKYDIEYEAAEWVVDLIRTYGRELVVKLDERYRRQGVSLGAFLGPQAWRT